MNNEEIFIEGLINDVRITLIGVGGAGCNTVNRLLSSSLRNIRLVAANTDLQHLEIVQAPIKLVLGKNTRKFRGAGG
ncbi:MAG: cell division protein FtsZ, partial [Nitrososphaerota archaeon]